ncbi:MAG: extracellular solute-binding protein [Oscillospiraceae bacterium]|jgi:hypothetical protein|nr:extracellular solute-binding protein [Oscillospiraceae bacterium]
MNKQILTKIFALFCCLIMLFTVASCQKKDTASGDIVSYDESGNPIYEDDVSKEILLDDDGNPVYDDNGNPVYIDPETGSRINGGSSSGGNSAGNTPGGSSTGSGNTNIVSGTKPQDKVEQTPDQIANIQKLEDHVINEKIKNLGNSFQGKGNTKGTVKVMSFYPAGGPGGTYFGEAVGTRFKRDILQIEKDYNIKIEWQLMPINGYGANIVLEKAAGRVPANIFYWWSAELINNRIAADLRTVKSIDLAHNEWNAASILATTFNSNIYGVSASITTGDFMYFNKKLAEQYNLGDIYAMVRNKQWTFDKFVQLSQEIYNKSNHSIYGCTLFSQKSVIQNFVYCNDTKPITVVNGKAKYNGLDPKVEAAYTSLLKPGVFIPKEVSDAAGGDQQVFTDRKALFSYAGVNMNMNDDYGLIPLPIGPNATDYVEIISSAYEDMWYLYDEDPDIEDAGTVLVALANRIRVKSNEFDINKASKLRDDESLQMLHYLSNGSLKLMRQCTVPSYDIAIANIMNGTQTPAQALASIKNMADEEVELYFNVGGGQAPTL